jgi:hypothetical protein
MVPWEIHGGPHERLGVHEIRKDLPLAGSAGKSHTLTPAPEASGNELIKRAVTQVGISALEGLPLQGKRLETATARCSIKGSFTGTVTSLNVKHSSTSGIVNGPWPSP